MDTEQVVQHPRPTQQSSAAPPRRALSDGASVVLLRPRRLRGTIGIVRRRMSSGWEVEIRSSAGVPLHLTLPARALLLR